MVVEDCWCGWGVVTEVVRENGGSPGDAVVVHGQWLEMVVEKMKIACLGIWKIIV